MLHLIMTVIVSWNVNGLRAVMKKVNLNDFMKKHKVDIMCLSETKLSLPNDEIIELCKTSITGYRYRYFNTSERPGYSGTAILSKRKPDSVTYGCGSSADTEGRVITAHYPDFVLVNVYTPNSGQELGRLDFRCSAWDKTFRTYVSKLKRMNKHVIVCGDLNCARKEIDIHSPETNRKSAGFTDRERKSFDKLLNSGYIDTFRMLYPEETDQYTYWTYLRKARQRNKGWRIDYFLITKSLTKALKDSTIINTQLGSDHAPIKLKLSKNIN